MSLWMYLSVQNSQITIQTPAYPIRYKISLFMESNLVFTLIFFKKYFLSWLKSHGKQHS